MDRFTYAVIAGVLVLVAVGLGATAVLRGREVPPDLSTPGGVVLAYALAEQRGDAETAWNLLAPSVQARTDRELFLARAAHRGGDRTYYSIEEAQLDGTGASVVLVQTYAGSSGLLGTATSYSNRTTVRLSYDGSAWRITVPSDDHLLPVRR